MVKPGANNLGAKDSAKAGLWARLGLKRWSKRRATFSRRRRGIDELSSLGSLSVERSYIDTAHHRLKNGRIAVNDSSRNNDDMRTEHKTGVPSTVPSTGAII
jgi:hypothetical protein